MIPDIAIIRSKVRWLTFSGKLLERRTGPRTCVEIVLVMEATRSESISILDRLGAIVARTDTSPSDPSGLRPSIDVRPPPESAEVFSGPDVVESYENVIGFMVSVAVRRRTKRSCQD